MNKAIGKRLLSRFRSHAFLVTSYLIALSFATWQWQEATNAAQECEFDRIEHLIFDSQVESREATAATRQMILLQQNNTSPESWRSVYDGEENLAKLAREHLNRSKRGLDDLQRACNGIAEVGWGFLAISLVCGGAITLLTGSSSSVSALPKGEPLRRKFFWKRVALRKDRF